MINLIAKLIILFIITGAVFLMSTNDLVWATARVCLQLLEITNPEERIEDH